MWWYLHGGWDERVAFCLHVLIFQWYFLTAESVKPGILCMRTAAFFYCRFQIVHITKCPKEILVQYTLYANVLTWSRIVMQYFYERKKFSFIPYMSDHSEKTFMNNIRTCHTCKLVLTVENNAPAITGKYRTDQFGEHQKKHIK